MFDTGNRPEKENVIVQLGSAMWREFWNIRKPFHALQGDSRTLAQIFNIAANNLIQEINLNSVILLSIWKKEEFVNEAESILGKNFSLGFFAYNYYNTSCTSKWPFQRLYASKYCVLTSDCQKCVLQKCKKEYVTSRSNISIEFFYFYNDGARFHFLAPQLFHWVPATSHQ